MYLYGVSDESTFGRGKIAWLKSVRCWKCPATGENRLIGVTEDDEGNDWEIDLVEVFENHVRIALWSYNWETKQVELGDFPSDWMINRRGAKEG